MKPYDKSRVDVELASAHHAEAIGEITKEAFAKYAASTGLTSLDALKETVEDIEKDIQEKTVLVALYHGEVVGSLRLEFKEDYAYLTRFGVTIKYHNLGIGKSLLMATDSVVLERGFNQIKLHTAARCTENIVFYYKCGFYVHSTSNERGYIRALMIKEIEA